MTSSNLIHEMKLQAICDILAETQEGLTGSEISQLLQQCSIQDLENPGRGALPNEFFMKLKKSKRLYAALSNQQNRDNSSSGILNFIKAAMDPARYIDNKDLYDSRLSKLNVALSFTGMKLTETNTFVQIQKSETLSDAQRLATNFKTKLEQRNTHASILTYCTPELISNNYFHAVLEASKSVAAVIRQKSGLNSDGVKLVEDAFGIGKKSYPILAINTLVSETEKSEHTGFMNLVIGLMGMFRNPTAHEPKISWPMSEQDALDIMSLISLIHRKLDDAVKTNH